jgi:hypothetical protein
MGYPKIRKTKQEPIILKEIISELTCKYCGRGFTGFNKLRGHLGQCRKRAAFLRQVDRGFIVIVHRTYFYIKPQARMVLNYIEILRKKYMERNGQPELWERDIQTFIGALTMLELEKKLTFEIITKEKAIQQSHSVEVVLTDGSSGEAAETAPVTEKTAVEPEETAESQKKEPKALVEVIREKKLKAKTS